MKILSLRLADAEHAQLVAAALHNQRSLQKEIIFRLFRGSAPGSPDAGPGAESVGAGMVSEEISEQSSPTHETPAPAESGAAGAETSSADAGRSHRRARARSRPSPPEGFKPDFGTKLKK